MAIETERKFSLGADTPIPDLAPIAIPGERRTHDLRAVYYDTPDFLLARQRRTLRRRTGGADAGWHLKLPAGGDSRREIHAPLTEGPGERSVPRELRAAVAEIVGYAPLTPVLTLATTRLETDLLNGDGQPIALLCDDTVTATRAGKTKRWRELEVELTGAGTDADLDAIAAVLIEAGVTPSPSVSKLVQGLGKSLAKAEQARPRRKADAAEVIGAYLAAQVGVIQGREDGLRADEPDAVHKTRVATRRLRSALRTFRPILDTDRTNVMRTELKWIAEALGGPRDAEVIRARLVAEVAALPADAVVGPVVARVTTELEQRHGAAHAALVEALDSDRFRALSDALVRLVDAPPFNELAAARAKGLLPDLLDRVGRRTLKEWRHAEKLQGREQLLAWHETRKRAKAARYAWEAAIPALGATAEDAAARWEQVTEALGIVQDATVARARLVELAEAAREHGEPTFSYGVLYQREFDRIRDFHGQAVAAIEAARSTVS